MSTKNNPPVSPPPAELRLPPAERIEVEPDRLVLSVVLLRDHIDEARQAALVESIRNSGFASAAKGIRRADGTIVLTHGKRRWLAACTLGCTLPVDVRPEGVLVEIVEGLLAHAHPAPLLPIEEGRLYRNALKEMRRILGLHVTQKLFSQWFGIDEATLSMCLTIVRRITPELARRTGVEFAAANRQARKPLYEVAKIKDEEERAARLYKLLRGHWPLGYVPAPGAAEERAYSRRQRGVRTTYSIHDPAAITDVELEDLIALVRTDVARARGERRELAA